MDKGLNGFDAESVKEIYEEFVEFMSKLKKDAKQVEEKDGKIVLDKNNPNDVEWFNE